MDLSFMVVGSFDVPSVFEPFNMLLVEDFIYKTK
jgi:hypothetical protein